MWAINIQDDLSVAARFKQEAVEARLVPSLTAEHQTREPNASSHERSAPSAWACRDLMVASKTMVSTACMTSLSIGMPAANAVRTAMPNDGAMSPAAQRCDLRDRSHIMWNNWQGGHALYTLRPYKALHSSSL